MQARFAVPGDADALVALRAAMFDAIGETAPGSWHEAARAWFRAAPDRADVVLAVAEERGRVVSSAMVVLVPRPPSPGDPSSVSAHVAQVSTLPDHRRLGAARACLELVLAEAHRRGARRADLHATAEGAPLYAALGFRPSRHPSLRLDPLR